MRTEDKYIKRYHKHMSMIEDQDFFILSDLKDVVVFSKKEFL